MTTWRLPLASASRIHRLPPSASARRLPRVGRRSRRCVRHGMARWTRPRRVSPSPWPGRRRRRRPRPAADREEEAPRFHLVVDLLVEQSARTVAAGHRWSPGRPSGARLACSDRSRTELHRAERRRGHVRSEDQAAARWSTARAHRRSSATSRSTGGVIAAVGGDVGGDAAEVIDADGLRRDARVRRHPHALRRPGHVGSGARSVGQPRRDHGRGRQLRRRLRAGAPGRARSGSSS